MARVLMAGPEDAGLLVAMANPQPDKPWAPFVKEVSGALRPQRRGIDRTIGDQPSGHGPLIFAFDLP